MNFSCDTMNGVVGAPGQGVFKNRVAADNLCGVDCYAMGAFPACTGHFTGYVDARLRPCPTFTECETTQVGSPLGSVPPGCQWCAFEDRYCPSTMECGSAACLANTSCNPPHHVSHRPHHRHKKHHHGHHHKKHHHGHPSILTHKKHPSGTPVPLGQCIVNVHAMAQRNGLSPPQPMEGDGANDVCAPQAGDAPRSLWSGWKLSTPGGLCEHGGNIYGYTNPDQTEAHNLCMDPMPSVTQLFASY